MDVYGRKPSAPAGRHFRATINEWNPIYQLTRKLCSDLLDPQTLVEMIANQGAGPKNQKTCTMMADRFEAWMRENPKSSYRVKRRLPQLEMLDKFGLVSLSSPYRIERSLLQEWVKFLRHCGGFKVR